jgi:hypothetical protein
MMCGGRMGGRVEGELMRLSTFGTLSFDTNFVNLYCFFVLTIPFPISLGFVIL